MGNDVFANGREIACKSGSGKVIAAFPDVCFTPPDKVPPTPPGIPIPYPLTSMASDTDKGTKKVMISDKEVMKRDSSNFKKCAGDDAAQTAKKGMISSELTGKVFFTSWSMDVKIEGKNVVRHLDTTTSNHSSPNANDAVPWPYVDSSTLASDHPCKKEKKKEEEACGKSSSPPEPCTQKCKAARRCHLTPYGKQSPKSSPNCCDPEVAHHIVPNCLLQSTRGNAATNVGGLQKKGPKAYTLEKGLCVCTSGEKGVSTPIGSHKKMHEKTEEKLNKIFESGKDLELEDTITSAAKSHNETFRNADGGPRCRQKCIEAQLRDQFDKCGTGAKVKVRQVNTRSGSPRKRRSDGVSNR